MAKDTDEKKPIYKKWWFYFLIYVVIATIVTIVKWEVGVALFVIVIPVAGYFLITDLIRFSQDKRDEAEDARRKAAFDTEVELLGDLDNINIEDNDEINRIAEKYDKLNGYNPSSRFVSSRDLQSYIIEKVLPKEIVIARSAALSHFACVRYPFHDFLWKVLTQQAKNGIDPTKESIYFIISHINSPLFKRVFQKYGTKGLDLSVGQVSSRCGTRSQLILIALVGADDELTQLIRNGDSWKSVEEMNKMLEPTEENKDFLLKYESSEAIKEWKNARAQREEQLEAERAREAAKEAQKKAQKAAEIEALKMRCAVTMCAQCELNDGVICRGADRLRDDGTCGSFRRIN